MKEKILLLLLSIFTAMSCITYLHEPTSVYADNVSDDFEYDLEYDFATSSYTSCSIIKYNGDDTNVIIPSTIEGCPVTSIGWGAFKDCNNLVYVTIPNNVTSIGEDAFSGCDSLASITIPNGVTSIDERAFSGCSSLASVTIPNSVTSIGEDAFSGCYNYDDETGDYISSIKNVTYTGTEKQWYNINLSSGNDILSMLAGIEYSHIINDDSSISISGYNGNTDITTLTIPSMLGEHTVSSVNSTAFLDCKNLTSLIIPATIISLDEDESSDYIPFKSYDSLTEIIVDKDNPEYMSVDGVLYTKDGTRLLSCPNAKSGSLIIPEGVQYIYASGFSGDNRSALTGCNYLTNISLPASYSCGNYVNRGIIFSQCNNLEKFTVSKDSPYLLTDENGLLYSKDMCLIKCPRAKSGNLSLLKGVTTIGGYAFYGCSNLSSIVFPEGVTRFEIAEINGPKGWSSAFTLCTNLTTVTLPASLQEIPMSTFSSCKNLKDVYYTGTLEQWLKIEIESSNTPLRQATIHYNSQNTTTNNSDNTTTQTLYDNNTVELSNTSVTYTGKAITPKIIAKDKHGTLIDSNNYDVIYSNNKNVGQATCTVTFKGNYTGSVTKTFLIIPKGTKISKISAIKNGFSLKWKKQSKQTTGYEIQYSTNKKFKIAKTAKISKNKILFKKVSKLKTKRKYYVRIRTYKSATIQGKSKKLYSNWSNIKSITTKK